MSLSFEKSSFCYLPPKRIEGSELNTAIKHCQSLQVSSIFEDRCNEVVGRARRNTAQADNNLLRKREILKFRTPEKEDFTIIVHKVEKSNRENAISRINQFFKPL